jgi:hypothetical protein
VDRNPAGIRGNHPRILGIPRLVQFGAEEGLARISHKVSTAAAQPDMSTALRSLGLLDVLSSTPAGPSVARLVSTPVCAASLRNPVRNAG